MVGVVGLFAYGQPPEGLVGAVGVVGLFAYGQPPEGLVGVVGVVGFGAGVGDAAPLTN